MFKKIIAGILLLSVSTLFGMSLDKLNTATKAELMEIKGIGEKKADAIIKERRKGKFRSFKDFQRVAGVGEATARNVRNDVKVKSGTVQKK
jgi:competence protein ComEA